MTSPNPWQVQGQFPDGPDLGAGDGPMRPTSALKLAVWAALAVWCVVLIAEAITAQLQLDVIASADADRADVRSYDNLTLALTIWEYCATALVATALISWLFRVRANALVIRDDGQRWRKSWLVLGWFVPIVAFWVPKQVVDDIWTASKPAQQDRPGSGKHLLVSAWWLTWMLYCFLGTFAYKDIGTGGDLVSLRDTASVTLFLSFLGLLPALLLALVVWKVSRFQDTQTARITAALA
ncbi:DUF4328 domain-containing protein [Actinomadura scrupuli]|uniref:DUF4328 domain-containing protein n=1 Tax=Actinomadura scrupuli TaxID=559629 RepID=UPI003D957EA5